MSPTRERGQGNAARATGASPVRRVTAIFDSSASGLLLSAEHACVLGGNPGVAPVAREGFPCVCRFLCVYRFLRVYWFLRDEAGFTMGESQKFRSGGMLITTMIGLRMTDEFDRAPSSRELLTGAFFEKLPLICSLDEFAAVHTARHTARHTAGRARA